MFAANFQPSEPSRPKTKGLLIFYFLKLYNFGFYEIFVGSTGSELPRGYLEDKRFIVWMQQETDSLPVVYQYWKGYTVQIFYLGHFKISRHLLVLSKN